MTLESRARQAAHDFRRATAELDSFDSELRSFDRFRRRKQRNKRIGAFALAAMLTVATIVLVTRTFGEQQNLPVAPKTNGLIVYGRWNPGFEGVSLSTIAPDGSDKQDLFNITDCASWSPDGTKILATGSAVAGAALRPVTINPDGSGLVVLEGTNNPNLNLGCGGWSPDGTMLVVEGFNERGHTDLQGIYTVRASDGGNLVRLTRNPWGLADSYPQYSPDGTQVVFSRTKPRPTPDGAGAVFVVNADGTGLHRISPWGFAFLRNSWSPDGQWITFSKLDGRLFLVRPDASGFHEIPVEIPPGWSAQDPAWSPDGTMIAFAFVHDGQADIYTMRPDGTDLRQVTNTPDITEQTPDWGTVPG